MEKFVFVSGVKAGGRPADHLFEQGIDEDEPEGIYGVTKKQAELELLEVSKKTGLESDNR